jgi:hypothetical protein
VGVIRSWEMDDLTLPAEDTPFVRALWVRDHDGRIGFLGARSFTFVERFLTWWAHLGGAYSTSLHELSACSFEASLWLRGFLEGSAPEAWFADPTFDYSDEDPRTRLWREAVSAYRLTGTWGPGWSCAVCGADLIPSAPVGTRCPDHGGEIRSHWPAIAPASAPP